MTTMNKIKFIIKKANYIIQQQDNAEKADWYWYIFTDYLTIALKTSKNNDRITYSNPIDNPDQDQ